MTAIKTGDTVTIPSSDDPLEEHTVLALDTSEANGWPEGFAWLHGPEGYHTRAVNALIKTRVKTWYVLFYHDEYDARNENAYFGKAFTSEKELRDYLSKMVFVNGEVTSIIYHEE